MPISLQSKYWMGQLQHSVHLLSFSPSLFLSHVINAEISGGGKLRKEELTSSNTNRKSEPVNWKSLSVIQCTKNTIFSFHCVYNPCTTIDKWFCFVQPNWDVLVFVDGYNSLRTGTIIITVLTSPAITHYSG